MITPEAVKFRAVKMGIATGGMPNVSLIWACQKAEGQKACFGQGLTCSNQDCRWRGECRSLDFFADTPISSIVFGGNRAGKSLTKSVENKHNSEYKVEREPEPAGKEESLHIGSPGP
ncbi:MAG: hypothetical protein GY869_20710 [Planctomycetes bacterium]|nr:hypothetical protein [Planctomycetota bacterium]